MENKKASQPMQQYPPVVTVLGHVDHGKTTLLDAIRKSSIAQREFGGITQKIGASSVEIMHDGEKRFITFIDTPGHEAFATMRSRGVQAADIAILVVSSADGVMPQTKESIKLLQETKIPFIVALTKADLEAKMTEKVKQQLLKEGVMLEGLGGDIPYLEVSAKTGLNMKELLDLLVLSFDMRTISPEISDKAPLQAIVIESKLDTKAGNRATVVIKNGTLKVRDEVICEENIFRVRTLIDSFAKQIQQVSVGQAAEVLGMSALLPVGSVVTNKENAITVVSKTQAQNNQPYSPRSDQSKLGLIICADTQGSLEALRYALPEGVDIISERVGDVSDSDILLAKSTGAIVVGFNTKISSGVQKLAQTEKVLAKNYNIIYELIDEISDVVEGKLQALIEEVYGTAKVLAKFPFEKTFAAGISVLDGRVARGDRVRFMRGDTIVGESIINSLRVGKESQSKVEKGHEAGILLTPPLDFMPGDMILSHN
ncbi:MAG TPA: translation initiation factor IF-2 [Patescibacteria group bacterium]|nr:translation initiation factor IF-2 [Patescibacteria group bacterium]